MNRGFVVLSAFVLLSACRSTSMGKLEQFISPEIDGSKIKRIAVIADGPSRSDAQVTARARERFNTAGAAVIRRGGSWETDTQAVREICAQNAASTDNVDGVAMIGWNHVTLHDCASGKVATRVSGNYAGVDAMVDRVLRYIGHTPAAK